MTITSDSAYEELTRVLKAAFDQAASGKGKERHAGQDEPFEKQQICEIGRRLQGNHAAGPLFQAVKKIYESGRLPAERAIAELYGAINYAAAAILLFEESAGKVKSVEQTKEESSSDPVLQSVPMCEVCTAHITSKDNELLTKIAESRNFDQLIVYEKENGFFIFVDKDMMNACMLNIASVGLSRNFLDILRLASDQGYWWLKIDQDALSTTGLRKFDW